MVLNLKKIESSSPKDALCQVLVEIDPVVLEKKTFNSVNVFLLFRNYLHLENWGYFNSTNLNPLQPRIHCAKFG